MEWVVLRIIASARVFIRRKFYIATIRRLQGVNHLLFLPNVMPRLWWHYWDINEVLNYLLHRSIGLGALIEYFLLNPGILEFTYFHYYNVNNKYKEKVDFFCKARPLKQIAGHLLHRIMHKDMVTFLLSLSPGNIPQKICTCGLNKVGQI